LSEDNLVYLDTETSLPIPVNRVLDGAHQANMTEVVVIGWDENGDLYMSTSESDGGNVLWLLEVAKNRLLKGEG
jgi:hypothetical protein